MLVIRMQRTGRKGHAQFRVVVQDSRRTPTTGKVVARLGTYDPHAKTTNIDKEKAQFYLDHGAQPSPRVVRLLKAKKIKLPVWVKEPAKAEAKVRNPDKRRSTRPPEAEAPAEASAAPEPAASDETPATEETETTSATDEATEVHEEASAEPTEPVSEPAAEEKEAGDDEGASSEEPANDKS